jgi:hypothetical protein
MFDGPLLAHVLIGVEDVAVGIYHISSPQLFARRYAALVFIPARSSKSAIHTPLQRWTVYQPPVQSRVAWLTASPRARTSA